MILSVGFHKVDEFIRVCDGTRDSILFGPEKYDASYNRIEHLINQLCNNRNLFMSFCTSKKTLHLHNFVTT